MSLRVLELVIQVRKREWEAPVNTALLCCGDIPSASFLPTIARTDETDTYWVMRSRSTVLRSKSS